MILSSTPCRWQIVPRSSRKNASSAGRGGGGALYIPDPFLSTKADKRLFVTIVKPPFLAGPTIVALKVERLLKRSTFYFLCCLTLYLFGGVFNILLIISSNQCKSTLPRPAFSKSCRWAKRKSIIICQDHLWRFCFAHRCPKMIVLVIVREGSTKKWIFS